MIASLGRTGLRLAGDIFRRGALGRSLRETMHPLNLLPEGINALIVASTMPNASLLERIGAAGITAGYGQGASVLGNLGGHTVATLLGGRGRKTLPMVGELAAGQLSMFAPNPVLNGVYEREYANSQQQYQQALEEARAQGAASAMGSPGLDPIQAELNRRGMGNGLSLPAANGIRPISGPSGPGTIDDGYATEDPQLQKMRAILAGASLDSL